MKDLLLKLATAIVFVTGIGNLAASQIHILASTKIFQNQIGIYLFMFIIFGLTTAFNAILLEKFRSVISFVFAGIMATVGGIAFVRLLTSDVAAQEKLTMADVQTSYTMVIVSMVIYAVGVVVIPLLKWEEIKIAESL